MLNDLPTAEAIYVHVAAENFPVALRVLPRHQREELLALYGFARLVDDLGDEYHGDRSAALEWVESDLIAALVGQATLPTVSRLTPLLEERAGTFGLLRDLLNANRRDQHQHRYQTFDDLLDYCRLSANPVGRLVLGVFDIDLDPDIARWSDDVCSGLQVVEHLQDVAEDYAADRIYLPLDDLDKFAVAESDLGRVAATPDVRRLVAHEADRARELLRSGNDLAARLPLRPRTAIAGFTAGGLAAIDAIESVDYDVLGHQCRPGKRRLAVHAARVLTPRRRRR